VTHVEVAPEQELDVVVIGGGQAGLALGYYLRRTGLSFVILDAGPAPGGAWQHAWPSLRLFSPARWSSLPGWVMPGGPDYYPTRDEVLAYLREYERRYALPIRRPISVRAVESDGAGLLVTAQREAWRARAVVSATGTWSAPVVPCYPGQGQFRGELLHASDYRSPLAFAGQRVLVVGGGNTGAQLYAELSLVADASWVTRRPPTFLPDNVDGRSLFERATARYQAGQSCQLAPETQASLGDIVLVEPVREARERGVLRSVRPFTRFTERGVVWPDGAEERVDTVLWCTGFRPALEQLRGLGVLDATGHVAVHGTRAVREPRLWLLGYGEWTGYASATLIGVGRTARATAAEIAEALGARS
jgi:cation diffusion facilitator CzcD-associated flavoprotein CzcO